MIAFRQGESIGRYRLNGRTGKYDLDEPIVNLSANRTELLGFELTDDRINESAYEIDRNTSVTPESVKEWSEALKEVYGDNLRVELKELEVLFGNNRLSLRDGILRVHLGRDRELATYVGYDSLNLPRDITQDPALIGFVCS